MATTNVVSNTSPDSPAGESNGEQISTESPTAAHYQQRIFDVSY